MGRPYQVTKEKLFSIMMVNWMSYLGVRNLTINNHIWQDKRWAHESTNVETQYMYIERKLPVP